MTQKTLGWMKDKKTETDRKTRLKDVREREEQKSYSVIIEDRLAESSSLIENVNVPCSCQL